MIIFLLHKHAKERSSGPFSWFQKKGLHNRKYGVSRILAVILLCITFFSMGYPTNIYGEENLDMYSGSYALIDGNTGRVLTGKEEAMPMANASTTKILTCIVTLENSDINDMVTISSNASAQPRVRLGMGEGEEYPLKDLLYGLMLESYNDCAVAIAEHVAGSEEAFAELLNAKAKEIGCLDTYFITPNGLDAETEGQFHHTTAQDLCRIMRYCTWESPQKDLFLEITQTRNYSGTANGNTYSFVNRNAFLDQMEGVLSGKTGYTNKAGYCYVAALEQNGERYCIALLACGWPNNKSYKWHDARVLFSHGLENYEIKKVQIDKIQKQIMIDGYTGAAQFEDLYQQSELVLEAEECSYEILLSKDDVIDTELILYTDSQLPIVQGKQMGECNIYLNDTLLDAIALTAKENAAEWDFTNVLKLIFSKYMTFSS